MDSTQFRTMVLGGLIVSLISLLPLESQAAKKKSKQSVKNKANVAVVGKSKTKSKKSLESVEDSVAHSEKIKVHKRKPASPEAPPGVPTELPEKILFIPTEDSAANTLE